MIFRIQHLILQQVHFSGIMVLRIKIVAQQPFGLPILYKAQIKQCIPYHVPLFRQSSSCNHRQLTLHNIQLSETAGVDGRGLLSDT